MLNDSVCVGDVKDLGGGKFSVQLSVKSPEGTLSQTQTVSADGRDAAVAIAKECFARWLKKVTAVAIRNLPPKMRN